MLQIAELNSLRQIQGQKGTKNFLQGQVAIFGYFGPLITLQFRLPDFIR